MISESSHDFGAAIIEYIQTCINNNVCTNYCLYKNITNKYNFECATGSETIILKE